ncbi:hypothetical protein [Elioraea sp.]|uniref:hypothetical protein n=1 Tax=Elioraea sp. TaxID=2185103 RepID=UPI0025BB6940|nr:hypothetical protein [Elioraea sp.]
MIDGTVMEAIPRAPGTNPLRLQAGRSAASAGAAPRNDPRAPITTQHDSGAGRRAAMTMFTGVSIDDVPFSETVLQPWNGTWGSDTLVGLAGSYEIARFWRWFTLEPELGIAGRLGETNSVELWGAFYVRFDGFPWRERLRTTVALSTGLNWISSLPEAEAGTPAQPEQNTSSVLHYFSPEISFSLPQYEQYAVVLRYHHRSGVFGAINGVEDGSNIISLGLRYRLPSR